MALYKVDHDFLALSLPLPFVGLPLLPHWRVILLLLVGFLILFLERRKEAFIIIMFPFFQRFPPFILFMLIMFMFIVPLVVINLSKPHKWRAGVVCSVSSALTFGSSTVAVADPTQQAQTSQSVARRETAAGLMVWLLY